MIIATYARSTCRSAGVKMVGLVAQGVAVGVHEEHLGAYLQAALDCVVIADASGRVVEFNPAAERTFGYTREEALGRTLAELIVPPSLRERHRQAFARFAQTHEQRLFGQRLELTGMRADGSEFPVELALGQVSGEPLLICGAIRDLTDAKRAESDLRTLADQQAALRRVATLVADEAAPDVIFASVAEEIARILTADRCAIGRFEADDSMTIVAYWSNEEPKVPVGTRIGLQGDDVTAAVRESGRPILIDDHEAFSGPLMDYARTLGSLPRSTVAAPIFVEGRVWGSIFASTMAVEIAEGTESRVVDFAELVATAIANTEAREALGRLIDEQAALRRVATLVAQGTQPTEVFSAVSEEVGRLFRSRGTTIDLATTVRFDPGPEVVLVGASNVIEGLPLQARWQPTDLYVSTRVLRTGRSARIDERELDSDGGPVAESLRRMGLLSQVGSPIVVEGDVWGAMTLNATELLPPDAEERLEKFTALVATAISNTQARQDLQRLAEEQAALRRVATLVASGVEPRPLFDAIAQEVEALFGVGISAVVRFEGDGTVTVMGARGGRHTPGDRAQLDPDDVVAAVYRTGQVARINLEEWEGEPPAVMQDSGARSALATPIVVEGELWGAITIASLDGALVATTDRRLADFTALFATAIANMQAREQVTALAAEQAALRRVATLVAEGEAPRIVLDAVAAEMKALLGADQVALNRYEHDDAIVVLAHRGLDVRRTPVGSRVSLAGENATAIVRRTGRPARMEDYEGAAGALAELARATGLRSSVSAPIVVEAETWGVITASWKSEPSPPTDTEDRIARFAQLAGTAIANSEARAELERLAEEQASLRRVATLVAHGTPPSEVFTAVAEEVAQLLDLSWVGVMRYDSDNSFTVLATWGAHPFPTGSRWPLDGPSTFESVLRTGRPARIDDYTGLAGTVAEAAREAGIRGGIGAPIVVDGTTWGVIAAPLIAHHATPESAEIRLNLFTELVATAIANAESKSELAASRRRIVAASDDARRRIERDLHDGIQQRLVSIGMELGGLESALSPDDGLKLQVAEVTRGLRGTIDDLREISRGIHPAILSDGGLGAALRILARRSAVPVQLNTDLKGRLPERVEVAAYYVISEAMTNVAKHADASVVHIEVVELNGMLQLSIRDDGVGGADVSQGSGLVGLGDRVDALGGTITIDSPPGTGTSLVVTLPLIPEPSIADQASLG